MTEALQPSQVETCIPEFVTLARTIRLYRDPIWNSLDRGPSNAKSEATNTHLRALTKRAYGFHSPDILNAMPVLDLGGHRPSLPGRAKPPRIIQ